MKQAFYFILKSAFILNIFQFFYPHTFGHVGKQLDKNAKVNLKICEVTNWEANNYNTHIVQYLKKERELDNEIWSVNRI